MPLVSWDCLEVPGKGKCGRVSRATLGAGGKAESHHPLLFPATHISPALGLASSSGFLGDFYSKALPG